MSTITYEIKKVKVSPYHTLIAFIVFFITLQNANGRMEAAPPNPISPPVLTEKCALHEKLKCGADPFPASYLGIASGERAARPSATNKK